MHPASFVSPHSGTIGRLQNKLANAETLKHVRRAISTRLPFLTLESDVRNVVYANWIVPVAVVRHLVPPGVELEENAGTTILTILTYEHGHFGPAIAGPLRRLLPSPYQSNWRLYVRAVEGAAPAKPTTLFLANIFDSALYAVGTRLFSDVMLAHHAERFVHRFEHDHWISGAEGGGSAPSWTIRATASHDRHVPPAFAAFFQEYRDALHSLCMQDAAIAPLMALPALAHSEIELPIDVDTIAPLTTTDYCPGPLLTKLGAEDPPFCFLVPRVRFRVLTEIVIPNLASTPPST